LRIASVLTIFCGALLSGCGSSVREVYLGQPVALGQQLFLGRSLVYPARLRSNEKVAGRFIVTEDSIIFDAGPNENASHRWPFRDLRAVHRPTTNEVVIEPFEGSGYILELADAGLVDRDFRIVMGRLALAHQLR
jgi:hypothetical protein